MTAGMTLAAACLLAAALSATESSVTPRRQRMFAQKYVTVVGGEGRPVTGLGSEDFSLRDGGIRRPLQAAEPATLPLSIAVGVAGFDAVALDDRGESARRREHEVG